MRKIFSQFSKLQKFFTTISNNYDQHQEKTLSCKTVPVFNSVMEQERTSVSNYTTVESFLTTLATKVFSYESTYRHYITLESFSYGTKCSYQSFLALHVHVAINQYHAAHYTATKTT